MTDDDDPLERAWERMMDGAERARKFRVRALLISIVLPLVLFILLLVLMTAQPARAAYGTPQERVVCLPEFKRLCPWLTDDSSGEMLWLCLKINRSRFSPACSAVLRNNGY